MATSAGRELRDDSSTRRIIVVPKGQYHRLMRTDSRDDVPAGLKALVERRHPRPA